MTTLRVVLVSGLSGAGKASILRTLEDLGYEAVDNPPLTMVPDLVIRSERPLAIGLDARSRGFNADLVLSTLATLCQNPKLRPELVYAWADETALLRRFTETRRRHPISPQGRVLDGIAEEAELTRPLRQNADLVIDTSDLPLAELRKVIEARFRPDPSAGIQQPGMAVSLISFAFPAGLPREADMVFDARFLRNPHYDRVLRPRTGLDEAVASYIEADPDFMNFINGVTALITLVLPRFVQEGKKYATIAVGCTGGRHRSVHIVDLLARSLPAPSGSQAEQREWRVTVTHRELEREAAAPAQRAGSGRAAGDPAPPEMPGPRSIRGA